MRAVNAPRLATRACVRGFVAHGPLYLTRPRRALSHALVTKSVLSVGLLLAVTPAISVWMMSRPSALLYQEHSKRSLWMPHFWSTFRLLLIARTISALYSGIGDCDETFNYWEPLHLLSHPPRPLGQAQAPFQTWEYAPQYAIRSWAYVAQYMPIATAMSRIFGYEKSASFYAVRIVLAFSSSFCEAALLKSVAEVVHPRVARYMLVFLIFSAGLYESSTALLPSTFAMYTTTLAMSLAMIPSAAGADQYPRNRLVPTHSKSTRTLYATATFAFGALLAWPFALVLALPFVAEELLLPSGLLILRSRYSQFVTMRIGRWIRAVAFSALLAVPIFLIDTLAYARPVVVSLNIIAYNVLSAKRGAGPTLYGTEPWYYYIFNLALNFGPTLLLALVSLPAVVILSLTAPSHLAYHLERSSTVKAANAKKDDGNRFQSASEVLGSSALHLLILRLLPFYLWLALLTLQAHKEERFMFPAYPLLCFNAAVGLYSVLALLSNVFKSDGNGSQLGLHRKLRIRKAISAIALVVTSAISVSRSWHTTHAYRAPIAVLAHLTEYELPRIVAGHYSTRHSTEVQKRLSDDLPLVLSARKLTAQFPAQDRKHDPRVNLTQLVDLAHERSAGVQDEVIRLCYGKEWYRFPGTFLVPDGVTVDFIASDFRGILPKHFVRPPGITLQEKPVVAAVQTLDAYFGLLWPWASNTRAVQTGFNDMNREEIDRYVDVSSCDYLIDVDWPHRAATASYGSTSREPRFATDSVAWQRVHCEPFLDVVASRANGPPPPTRIAKARATLERAFWLPWFVQGDTNRYGDYCLLRTTRRDSLVSLNATGSEVV